MFAKYSVRYLKLLLGLYLFGWGVALLVQSAIGVPPWDVLAQGLSIQLHVSYGFASIIVSGLVLLTWIPLRQKPGVGTVLNGVLVGIFADSVFPLLPHLSIYWQQLLMFLLGMAALATATGFYISASLGAGPRDGLMVGLQRTLKRPLWQVRTVVEVLVLTTGWLMGGQVREGTLIFALGIGYLMQLSFRIFKVKTHKSESANLKSYVK